MTGSRLTLITAALMLSLFLASIEQTVVSTAMPTIVSQLGGLSIYAWVFSAYMLASTTAVPIFGKLSDIYGRLPIYLVAMTIFLIGSLLCGLATTMPQLIFLRAIQGLGAGGLMPLSFTIIGDIFTFEQRAKMQGLFSGVWGFSSIVGPLIGGFFVDQISWHWVFFINIPPGLIATALMIWMWRDVTPRTGGQVDFLGAGLLSVAIVSLLLALFQLNERQNMNPAVFWSLLVTATILSTILLIVERRAANPILPLALFRERLFLVAIGHGFLSGFALFGATAFIPLFVESVLGTSATQAGATLTPLMLGWVLASVTGTRLLLRIPYRTLAIFGMTALMIGTGVLVIFLSPTIPQEILLICGGVMGIGMGLSVPAFLLAVQSTVARQSLGTATATVQFSRSIGGTVGVSVMGVILVLRLASALTASGIDPEAISLNALLDSSAATAPAIQNAVRAALASAVQFVFIGALIAAGLAWFVAVLAPRGKIQTRARPAPESRVESIPAE